MVGPLTKNKKNEVYLYWWLYKNEKSLSTVVGKVVP